MLFKNKLESVVYYETAIHAAKLAKRTDIKISPAD